MEYRNVFSWTIMISATIELDSTYKNALKLFEHMLLEGMKPRDSFVYTSILGGCASLGCSGLADGVKIHSLVLLQDNMCFGDPIVGTALISMYGKCGSLQGAESVFEHMENKNLCSWNALLHAYAKNGDFGSAFSIFYSMLQTGVGADSVTLIGMLDVCSAAGAEAAGGVLQETFIDCEYMRWSDEVILKTAALHMHVRFGDLHSAIQVFEQMKCRSLVSWNVMVTGYAQAGYTSQAMELFWKMEQEGLKPDEFTFTTLLGICSEARAAQALQERVLSSCWSLSVFNAMLTMHGRLVNPDSVDLVFQLMPEKDVVSWNAVIAAYAQNGHHARCFLAYQRMSLEGVKANRITFVSLLEACSSIPAVKFINSHISEDCRLGSDTMVGTALINIYSRLGSLVDARHVFLRLEDRNEVTWTAILVAHAQHRVDVSELYSAMNLEGLNPNNVTFIGILFSCCHRGVLDEGMRFYQTMVGDHGIHPSPDHLVCILDLLAKAGLLTHVEECLQSNMVPRTKILLNSLLSNCKLQGDVESGKRAVSVSTPASL